jgi:hypothetical protein
MFNFHHGYGGFGKWAFERYAKNILYRRIARVAWFPVAAYWVCKVEDFIANPS